MYKGYITDIQGIKVGHADSEEGQTGVTAILIEEGAVAGVDVRGSGPGTRETDLLDPKKTVNKVHAVVLSGGSAFGLDSASGVMQYLEEKSIGFDVGVARVPIVPAAVIFDLYLGNPKIRPDKSMGYLAASLASKDESRQGNVGAGMGATVGKLKGPKQAMKSGLGSATVTVGDLKVSALIVVNAIGDIFSYEDSSQIAGIYDYENDVLLNSLDYLKKEFLSNDSIERAHTNTTIGVVATNAKLDKSECNKLAEMSHNGYAQVINPIHTSLDGDTIFALSKGDINASIDLVGSLAREAVAKAINNAIINADSLGNLISFKDIK